VNSYKGIDKFIVIVIEKEAEKIKTRLHGTGQGLEDIMQDLHVQVWEKLSGKFTHAHPLYKAAVRRTVDSKIKDVLEHKNAEKRRTNLNNLHLESPVADDEGKEIPYSEAIDLEECMEVHGTAAPAWHRRRHQKLDVEQALARLPKQLRRVADALEEFGSNYSEVERQLGVSRKKLRCDMQKLRRLMKEFLDL